MKKKNTCLSITGESPDIGYKYGKCVKTILPGKAIFSCILF